MIRLILLTLIFTLAWSCIPTANNNGVDCGINYVYNPVTRGCDSPINMVTDPSLAYITINEDSGSNYTVLTYSDVENDIGTSCAILTYTDGIDDTPPSACSCDAVGVCSTSITPDSNYHGTAQFSYNIVDQDGTSKTKAVYVVINSVNDTPVAANGSYSTDEETVIFNGDLSTFVTDPDIGESFTYSIVSEPSEGTINNLNSGTGTFSFTPLNNDTLHQNDISTMVYKVCDRVGSCGEGIITFTVTPVNDAPVPVTQSLTVPEGVALNSFTIETAFDKEGDGLTYIIVTDPTQGTLSGACKDSGGVSCGYTPSSESYYGSDSFTYKVCDDYDSSCSAVTTVVIYITNYNDPPTVGADQTINTVVEDTPATFGFTLNPGSDEEGGGLDSSYNLSYEIQTDPANGSISGCKLATPPESGGDCIYTPGLNFTGTDSFTYKVYDGAAYSAAVGTVTFNVQPDNDDPTIGTISRLEIAEGTSATSDNFLVDEGGGSYEDNQVISISVSSSKPTMVDASAIEIYYDSDGDGTGELLGTGAGPFTLTTLWAGDSTQSSNLNGNQYFSLKVTSLVGGTGTATITVTANDGSGGSTDQTFDVYVPELSSKHAGWKHVSAIGKKIDKSGNELTTENVIHLEWHQFTLAGTGEVENVTIQGWNLYRRKHGEAYGSTPVNGSTLIPSTQLYYTDTGLDPNQVYYYKVVVVDSLFGYEVPTGEPHSEIRIVSPPANMAFVHRWMVNQEVCGKMNMTTSTGDIEKSDNFRCNYVGPGDDVDRDGVSDGHYDIGRDMLVDLSEAGCPYSSASAAPECGVNGCIGIGTPTAKGITPSVTNLVYYNRHTGVCYQSNGVVSPANWEEFNGAVYSDTVAEASQKALLPPLVMINQQSAYTLCTTRDDLTGTIAGIDGILSFTLPTRKEQIGYSAWNDLNTTGLSDGQISELEEGIELDNVSKCNSAQANGLTTGYTAVEIPASSFAYAVTGTDFSGIRSVYTGSEELGGNALTPDCISRYGIQDPYGNVSEWLQDQITCSDAAGKYTCSEAGIVSNAAYSDFEVSDPFFVAYSLDGLTGPCVNADSCDSALTGWYFDDDGNSNLGKRMLIPLALPVTVDFEVIKPGSGVIPYLMPIGSNAGISDSALHDDYFGVNAQDIIDSGVEGAMIAGGSFLSGNKAGRYTVEFKPVSTQATDIGFRCVVPIPSTAYDTAGDILHTYSY